MILLLACCAVLVLPASGDEAPTLVFGPKQFTRLADRPQTFTEIFTHCGTAQCQIVVTNGNANGTNRVSSASVRLNGVEVVAASDFNQQSATIIKPVVLTDRNVLAVTLNSGRGSFISITVECATSPVKLSTGTPGVSLQDSATLLSAIPILNDGTAAAQSVMVTAITLAGGTLASPASLPFDLGSIPAENSTVLNATFSGGPFIPGSSYALTVEGLYALGPAIYCFTLHNDLLVPPASPGSAIVNAAKVEVQRAAGGPFPPKPFGEEEEANPQGAPIPIGPLSRIFPDTVNGTALLDFSHLTTFPGPAPGEVSGANVAFVRNVTNPGAGFPPDPSAASSGRVVMTSYNTAVQISTDGGNTFTTYNPTTIYADNPDGGLCCDQVIHYVPSINRFVWLIQTSRTKLPGDTAKTGNTGPNRERLAVASPEAIESNFYSAWSFWDLTSAVFGFGNNWMDFPELAVGNNFLYMSVDAVGSGLFVTRIPLSQLRDAVNADVEFTTSSDGAVAYGSHICQNVGDTAFWAGHNSTSKMRIFRWAENSGQYGWRDVTVNSWTNNDFTSQAPDGQYWLPAPLGSGIIGATRKIVSSIVPPGETPPPNEVWFAWTAGRNTAGGRPHPYVEVVRVNDQNSDILDQFQIWNGDHAFAVPALNADPTSGDVAISLAWGGGRRYYANNAVGFIGDFVVYSTSASDVTLTANPTPGSNCPDVSGGVTLNRCSRYGDYFSVRRVGTSPCIFSTLGYATRLANPATSTDCLVAPGCGTVVNYVEFGRDGCIFPPGPPR